VTELVTRPWRFVAWRCSAIAVDNARLLGELEGKAALEERHHLARELHDSVSQALFSMNLHARAAQMAAQESEASQAGR
jgi:signal transduction histidine kinase